MRIHHPCASSTLKRVRAFARILIFACIAPACAPAWAAAGNTAWTSVYAPGGEPASMSVMAVSGKIAYAEIAGPYNGEPSSDADIHLRAFDIPTGAVLWEDDWAASSIDDSVSDIAASGGRAFIAGLVGSNSQFRSYDWMVRAYAGKSGAVLWEDRCPAGFAEPLTSTSPMPSVSRSRSPS